ncbi:MAG: ATP-dependent DNA helicase [Rhodocyclaceae bacterium]|nr:ATP-dependent DNA helicase [Rhodocyclaceae bacterium]
MSDDRSIAQCFNGDGPLAGAIDGFRPRAQQVEMACAIDEAMRERRALVVEAGTGTGKTFAYLVPALLAGGKVIVSTGTKTLQDQLFRRDLPTVRDALRIGADIALLKGRANYVCPYHLARNASEGRFRSAEEAADLRAILRFAEVTQSGDKSEFGAVAEESAAWFAATSTRDNCLGQECPHFPEQCFVHKARRKAMEADLVVVNHHLFFADVMLRDEGMGELLPAVDAVVFDEAHQLPETASLFFGSNLTTGQLLDLGRDIRNETIASARDCTALIDAAHAVDKAARDLRLAVAGENVRLRYRQLAGQPEFDAALATVDEKLAAIEAVLETQAERSEGLAKCLERCGQLRSRLSAWRAPEAPGMVRWGEVFSQSLALNATPLSIAEIFRREMGQQARAWIFTSATLAVGRDFGHFLAEMGLDRIEPAVRTASWGSPFDYPSHALLYAPTGMPDPNHPNYPEAVAERAWPVLQAARGRSFVLCTSLRAMRRVHEALAKALAASGDDLLLLLQGEQSRAELLDRFRRSGKAILVASQSFWEGVDVPGDALSIVVIDKLPFAPPDDPVLSARIDHLRANGGNPFFDYQLPRAVISMKQGAGRLIRSERDRGVLLVCDPRMVDKPYGKRVWRSLPPMARTRALDQALAFVETMDAAGAVVAKG